MPAAICYCMAWSAHCCLRCCYYSSCHYIICRARSLKNCWYMNCSFISSLPYCSSGSVAASWSKGPVGGCYIDSGFCNGVGSLLSLFSRFTMIVSCLSPSSWGSSSSELLSSSELATEPCGLRPVSYTHLTLPTNREV